MYFFLLFLAFLLFFLILYSISKHQQEIIHDQLIAESPLSSPDIIYEIPAFEESLNSYQELFDLARIYRFGLGENEEHKNKNKALQIYLFIIAQGDDLQISEARQLFQETNQERQIEQALVNQPFRPYDFPKSPEIHQRLSVFQKQHRSIPRMKPKSKRSIRRKKRPSQLQQDIASRVDKYDKILQRENRPNALWRHFPTPTYNNIPPTTVTVGLGAPRVAIVTPTANPLVAKNDTQNVHDSMVVRTTKTSLDKLANNSSGNIPQSLEELRQELRRQNNPHALDAFEKMVSINDYISPFSKSEQEVLHLVWQRINNPVNSDLKKDMTDILVTQLQDCKTQICPMGRCSRILQTLEATDKEDIVKIKPQWAINREIQNTTSKIYQETLESVDEATRITTSLDESDATSEQKILYNNFKAKFAENFKNKLSEDYLTNGILSEESIKSEVDKAVDAIS